MAKYPELFADFQAKYPKMWKAYDQLGAEAHKAGPLDEKTRALVKLGLAIGAHLEGAVYSHTGRALEAGVKPEEIRHVALLAATTLGFPTMMQTLAWVEDALKNQ